MRWLADASLRRPPERAGGLLDGLPGAAAVLAALGEGDAALELLERTSAGPPPTGADLATGRAGRALAALRVTRATGGPGACPPPEVFRTASDLARLGRGETVPGLTAPPSAGLLRGLSGAALLHLELYELTGERHLLDSARDILHREAAHCVRMPGGSVQVKDGRRHLLYLDQGSGGFALVARAYLDHCEDPLLYDRPRPERLSGAGALHTWRVQGPVPGRLAEAAAALGTTPYVVLAATFATWAGRLCGGLPDVVLAASSANRSAAERAGVVGFLGDAVLVRARLGAADTFADLVRQLGATLFTALDHQELPLTEVVEVVSGETVESLFPTVLFSVVTTPPPNLPVRGLTTSVRALPTSGAARNELYVVVVPGPGELTVTFEYSTDLFDEATVTAWADDFTELLEQVLPKP